MKQQKNDVTKALAQKRCREKNKAKNLGRADEIYSEPHLSSTKVCTKCKKSLELRLFKQSLDRADGFDSWCSSCVAERARQRYAEKPDEAIRRKQYREENKDIYRKASLKYYHSNKESQQERAKEWRQENKAELNAKYKAYKLRKKGAVPPWADLTEIRKIYQYARDWTLITGIQQSVDHIIPLKGEQVCGLHVEANLRILPWVENVVKKNRFDPDTYTHELPCTLGPST